MQKSVIRNNMEAGKGVTYDLHVQGDNISHILQKMSTERDHSKHVTKRLISDEAIYPPKKRVLFEHKKLNGNNSNQKHDFPSFNKKESLEGKFENVNVVNFSRPRSDSLHSSYSQSSEHSESVSSVSREPSPYTIHGLYDNHRTPERNPMTAFVSLNSDISKPLFPPSSDSDSSVADSDGHNSVNQSPEISYASNREVCQKNETSVRVDDILNHMHKNFPRTHTLTSSENVTHLMSPEGSSLSNKYVISDGSSSLPSFQNENIPERSSHLANTLKNGSQTIFDKSRLPDTFPYSHIPHSMSDNSNQYASLELKLHRSNDSQKTSLEPADNSYMGPMDSLLSKFNMGSVNGRQNLKLEKKKKTKVNSSLNEFDCNIMSAEKTLYKCRECNKEFKQSGQLSAHMKSHDTNYKCRICNELFVTGDELLNHMKADHAGDNPYKCEHCSREFSQYNNLRRHLRVHRDKIYKCNQCDREFNEEFYLTMHMGTHTGKRVYSCGVCNACFSTSHDLKMHVKTHSPSELHTCEVCGKSFSKACVLRQHKKGHSGDRPHKCEKCPKTFIHRHHLTMHMRSHVESKPYTCDLCQKEFYQSSHLYKHMRSHEEGKENSNDGQIDEFRTNRHEFKKIKEYHTHKTKENVLKTNVEYAVNNQEKVEVTLLQKTSSDVKTRKRSKSQANTVQSPVRPQTNVHALPPITQSLSFQQVGGHYPPHFPHPGLSAIGPRENHSSHGNYYPTGYNPAMFGSPLHGSQDYQNLYRAAYTAQMQAYYNSMYMMNYLSQNAMLQQAKGHLDVGYGVHGLPKVSHSKGHTEVNQFSNYRDINHAKSETDTKLPNNYHSFSQTKEQEEGDEHCKMTNAFIENDTCDKTIEMVTKQHRDKGEVQSNQDTDIAKFDGIGEDKARAEVAQQLVQMSTGVLSKSPNCVEKDTASSIEIPSAVTITTPTGSVSVSVTPVSVSVTPDIDVPNNGNQPKRIDFSKCINAIIDRSFIEASSTAESNIQRLTTESKDKIRSESNKKNPDCGTTTNAGVTSPPYQTINQTLNNVSRSVTHSLDNVPTPVTTRSEKYCSRLMMPYSNDSVPVNYSKIDRRDKPEPFNHYSVALNLSKTNSEDSEPVQSRSLAEIGLNQSTYLERRASSLKPSHMETSPAYLQTQSLLLKSSNMENSPSSSYHCESRTPFSPMSEIEQPRKTGQEARIKTNTNFTENRPKIGEEENTSDVYKMKDLMKFSNVSANNSNHYHQREENEHNKSIGQENQNSLQPKHNMSNILLESRTVTPSFNTGVVTLSHLPKKIFLQQHYETQNARNDIVGTHLDKKTIVRDSNDTEKEEIIYVSDKKLESNSFRNADCANSFDEYSVNDNDSDDIKNLRLKIEEVKNRIRLESGRSQDENLENSHKYKDIKLFKTTCTGNGVEIKINENSVGIEKAGETKDRNELEKSMEDSCDDSLDEKRLEIDLDVDSQKIEVTVYNKDVGDEKRDEKHVEIGNDKNDVEMENVGLDEEIGKIDSIFSARISVENNTGSDSKTSDLEMDEYILKREGERINCYNNLQAKSGNEDKLVADKNASGIVEVKNFENASLRKVDSFKSTELIKKDSDMVEGSEYPLDLRQSYKTKGKRRSKNGQNGNVKSRNKREMNLKNENWKENLVKLNSQNDKNSKIENLNSSVNLTCVICWEMFDSLPDLEGHQLEHMKKLGTLNQCQLCDKAFARPFDLQCHILDHRKNLGENTENDKLLKSVSKEPTKLNGRDYDFNRVLTPKSHSKSFSDAGNGALKDRYKCDYCAETFDQSKSLKDHVLLHTVQKPYKCTVCLRGFAHKHNLNRHMMSHNAKSYECKVCDRTFKESFYLQMHMKIHSEDKYKRCEICGLQVPRSEIWKHTSDHIGNIVENPTYEQIGHRVEEILSEQNSENGMSNLNIDVMSKQIGKFSESKGSYDQLANLMHLTKCIVGKEGQGETEKSAHSCKTDEHLNIHLNRNSSLSVYTQNI